MVAANAVGLGNVAHRKSRGSGRFRPTLFSFSPEPPIAAHQWRRPNWPEVADSKLVGFEGTVTAGPFKIPGRGDYPHV
jgi:hypothetical protein